jgi:hypothetical protein
VKVVLKTIDYSSIYQFGNRLRASGVVADVDADYEYNAKRGRDGYELNVRVKFK